MKKVLDFSRVPLDKWCELLTQVENAEHVSNGMLKVFDDIEQLATTEVKEEADINAEIAEKLLEFVDTDMTLGELLVDEGLAALVNQKKALKESENKSEDKQKEEDKTGEPG